MKILQRNRHTLQTHSSSFLTQRTYSCSNLVAVSSLALELLKKCRVWLVVGHPVFNCNWVATRWQLFSTHVDNKQYRERHKTNNTIIHRTQKIHRTIQQLGRMRAVPLFAGFTLAFDLQLRKKHGKTSVRVTVYKHTIRIHSHNNKNT